MAENNIQGKITRYSFDTIVKVLEETSVSSYSTMDICAKYGISERVLLMWREEWRVVPKGALRMLLFLQERNRNPSKQRAEDNSALSSAYSHTPLSEFRMVS